MFFLKKSIESVTTTTRVLKGARHGKNKKFGANNVFWFILVFYLRHWPDIYCFLPLQDRLQLIIRLILYIGEELIHPKIILFTLGHSLQGISTEFSLAMTVHYEQERRCP